MLPALSRRFLPAAALAAVLALACSAPPPRSGAIAWQAASLDEGEPAPFGGWLRRHRVPIVGVEAVYIHEGERAPFDGTLGRVLHWRRRLSDPR